MPNASPGEREQLLANAQARADFAGATDPITFEVARSIELCPVRSSECGCVGKPAICRRSGEPELVICTKAGPGGGPCPGVSIE